MRIDYGANAGKMHARRWQEAGALPMADIINLKDRRKRKAREQKEIDAAAQRMMFGRTKGEKQRTEIETTTNARKLDGAKRERTEDND